MNYLERVNNYYLRVRRMTQPRMTEKIFFLHQPKCGGTSIGRAIWNCYPQAETSHLNNDACNKAADVLGRDLDDYRRDLLLYNLLQENIKFVSGHFAYSEKAYQKCGDQWHFLTVLRHPIKRWFSHYFYSKYNSNAHFGISEDISTFESHRAFMIGCLYVRNLSEGFDWTDRNNVDMDRAVEMAIKALDNFSLVGCLEHLDLMKQQFEEKFGVKLFIDTSNKNPISKVKQQQEISDDVRKKVEEICAPDMVVYNYALKKIGVE